MLTSTFQHIKGIGKIKEKSLWRKGILSWDEYEDFLASNFPLFANLEDFETEKFFELSRKALAQSDLDFFGRYLDRKEHYRIALSFPKDILYLDIETTGLSIYYDDLTMVGWDYQDKYNLYITGDSQDKLLADLKKAKIIITFNGTLFEVHLSSHWSYGRAEEN
jgi:uncharacterized protein YprB with RNaseH-like and TPR domain